MTFLELGPGRDFVLLALPKTASTALERTLSPYATEVGQRTARPASTSRRAASCTPRRTSSPSRGTRASPTSWSRCSVSRSPGSSRGGATAAREDSRQSTADMTFEEFALHYLAGHDDAPIPKGRPARFIHAQGAVAVDRVFAVERPDVWSAWFSERVGRPLDVRAAQRLHRRARASSASRRARGAGGPLRAGVRRVAPARGDTGEWSGARGTRLPDLDGGPGRQS